VTIEEISQSEWSAALQVICKCEELNSNDAAGLHAKALGQRSLMAFAPPGMLSLARRT